MVSFLTTSQSRVFAYGQRELRRLHILFVDRDPLTHEKIRKALQGDFSVQCVGTVQEAIKSLQATLPDMLISEVVVGAESGLDLCRYVRSVPALQGLPVMLLTSLATSQDKVAGFHAGTDDYVVKPFDSRHLVARIRLLNRIKHLERRADA